MNKNVLFAVPALALGLAACAPSTASQTTASEAPREKLTIIATANPHEVILEEAKKILADQYQIDLEITETEDYYTPNRAVSDGDYDANFFQHLPFFENEVKERGYDIVNVGGVEIEPFGFYSRKYSSVEELPDGAVIITSNSVADHGRILEILSEAGLIELKEGVNSLTATKEDIVSNPHNLDFSIEVNPEQLTNALDDPKADLVAINGNYAIGAGLKPSEDALILEKGGSENPYVNIVAVKKGHEEDAKIKALIEVLQSDEIKQFIRETWADGSVIPAE